MNTTTTRDRCGDGRKGKPMSFRAIIRHYRERWLPTSEFKWFRDMPSPAAAIEAAALSLDENGKIFSHQLDRIGKPVADFQRAAEALLASADEIEDCRNFDDLLNLVEAVLKRTFPGSNKQLYAYDVAFRISAYLDRQRPGLLPTLIYLHHQTSGTRRGAETLGIPTKGRRAIAVSELPQELQQLPAWQLEDVLCLYCKRFPKRWRHEKSVDHTT